MDAVPVTLGQEFAGYAAQVREGAQRVTDALVRVRKLPLGVEARWPTCGPRRGAACAP